MASFYKPERHAMWLLAAANLLLPIALLTFATGFFPYKPFIGGINQFNQVDLENRPDAPFEKVVFMVVDALRSDFVYSNNSGFSFVQSLIRSGEAIPFTGHAKSPTITMPRIKALTTGSIPSFLDVILNFAESDTTSTLANQDTWPLQLSLTKGGKINMFGDDTWIKLFPKLFSRTDGTTSFFVSDFTEVDNNVTRNVPDELQRADWNGMILHYLGLDHIGHKTGPNSPNMIPKQKEMDNIVSVIYNSIVSELHLASTLLVLCGDHGMNEAGNHGGSAPGETSTALVFISPKFKQISTGYPSPAPQPTDEFRYYKMVEQSDVVPTLAGLLGLPIPMNNLGVFIPEFLPFWSSVQDKQWLLQKNVAQMMGIVKPAFSSVPFNVPSAAIHCEDPSGDATRLYCGYHNATQSLLGDPNTGEGINHAYKFLRDVQSTLGSVSSNYNMPSLIGGVLVSLTAYVVAVVSFVRAASFSWVAPSSLTILVWTNLTQVLYGIMMFASSYVEEEQHFWYWISSAWLLWLYMTRYSSSKNSTVLACGVALVVSRVVRRWNQTGQKFAGEPDIARILLSYNRVLWLLAIATYLFAISKCHWRSPSRFSQVVAFSSNTLTLLAAMAFKVAFTSADAPELLKGLPFAVQVQSMLQHYGLPYLARCVFSGVSLSILIPMVLSRGSNAKTHPINVASYLHATFTIILLTQTRLHNIPLLLLFFLQFSILKRLSLSHAETTLTVFLFQHASFFAYGGSNAISSIDLSNAYNGVTGYNALAVGLLTFVSNWAGPVWWSLGGMVLLLQNSKTSSSWQAYFKHSTILTMMMASNLVFVQVACLMLRSHLFIWSVFSPKYLYMMAWTLGQHLGVNVLLSSAVYWAATST